MKTSNKFVVAAVAGLLATTSLGSVAAFATTPDAATTQQAPYATQKELLKTADQALVTLKSVHSARVALMDNEIDVGAAKVADAKDALTQGETDLKALRVADTEKTDAQADYLPFDVSMMLTDSFQPTDANKAAVKKAQDQMSSGDKNAAIDTLRLASVDVNISAAMLPESASMDNLNKAADLIKQKNYFDANLALKSIEDSVIVRSFGVDAIPVQGAVN
ncbi:YfdX family protein [Pseudorhodobacter sp.]|uniref:YfdX family protein n=1 Tax=Pseudorhodobacter sp. TaxID=1934400 RepID=UPI002649B533|nr:YfdX family protein [Pseudorhodobacter sp.]MDN5787958.1 YfdX family protein [Pseudorhodobacter sp.]